MMTKTSQSQIDLAGLGPYMLGSQHQLALDWHYAIKGLMRRGEVSMLHGQSNTGKTALLSYAASRIANGLDFLGHRTKRGIVVHIAAEAPESVLERYHAHASDHQSAASAEYVVRRRGIDLGDGDQVGKCVTELRAISEILAEDIVLICIDTLVLCIGARNENDSGEMAMVTSGAHTLAQEIDAHVCLVHHDVKSGQGYRGSSVFRSNVDSELALSVDDAGIVTLTSEKQRTMQRTSSLHFRLEEHVLGHDEDGEKRSTVRVRPATPTMSSHTKAKNSDAGNVRLIAIRTALTLLGMSHDRPTYRFRPADLVAVLPPELFGDISEESKVKAVLRLLTELAKTSPAQVAKGEAGSWMIV